MDLEKKIKDILLVEKIYFGKIYLCEQRKFSEIDGTFYFSSLPKSVEGCFVKRGKVLVEIISGVVFPLLIDNNKRNYYFNGNVYVIGSMVLSNDLKVSLKKKYFNMYKKIII